MNEGQVQTQLIDLREMSLDGLLSSGIAAAKNTALDHIIESACSERNSHFTQCIGTD